MTLENPETALSSEIGCNLANSYSRQNVLHAYIERCQLMDRTGLVSFSIFLHTVLFVTCTWLTTCGKKYTGKNFGSLYCELPNVLYNVNYVSVN